MISSVNTADSMKMMKIDSSLEYGVLGYATCSQQYR